MMLTTVPYYRIERDEDGRPNRDFDRLFMFALRWQPEVEISAEMISATSRKKGEPPQHAGTAALHTLRDAGDISQRQLDAALCYLFDAIAYYEGGPDEPYPGRNEEASNNLRELLHELHDPTPEDFRNLIREAHDKGIGR